MNKEQQDLINICKDLNERMNKLEDNVQRLLDELKPITIKTSIDGNHPIDEEFDYTNKYR